jgi:hypothetical protein
MTTFRTASPRRRSIRQTDRQIHVTPVYLSHASLTVVCSTNLGVQQGNYTARIDSRSLAKGRGWERPADKSVELKSRVESRSVSQSASQSVSLSCIKSNLDTVGSWTDCMRNLELWSVWCMCQITWYKQDRAVCHIPCVSFKPQGMSHLKTILHAMPFHVCLLSHEKNL